MEAEEDKGLEDGGWKSQMIMPLVIGSVVVAIGLLVSLVVMLSEQTIGQTGALTPLTPW